MQVLQENAMHKTFLTSIRTAENGKAKGLWDIFIKNSSKDIKEEAATEKEKKLKGSDRPDASILHGQSPGQN